MKLSVAIEALWSMAAQEAISVRFPEIEPEHFLEALLKVSEMPPDALVGLAPGSAAARCLASEAAEVQREVARLSIKTTKARRELRIALGGGTSPHSGDTIHRSPASREIFDAAARLSSDAGGDVLTAAFLLKAILASPTPAIAKVLGNAVDQAATADEQIPLLAEYGHDLIKEARESPPPQAPLSPECKALLQAMNHGKGKALFLVSADVESAGTLVMNATRAIARREAGSELWGRRIFDVSQVQRGGTGSDGILLQRLLAEAASIPAVLLVLPAVSAGRSADDLLWLREAMKRSPVQCICPVSPDVYQASIARDPSWKKVSRVIWLRAPERVEVPWEL